MADNVQLNLGTGGDVAAADDIGGVKFQRVKITVGADGVNGGDVSTSNPLPISDAGGSITVDGPLTDTQLRATAVPVDGSGVTQPVSAVSLPLPSGASTSAKQDTANTSLASIDGKLPALATGRVPVDGSGVTQPVSAASLPLPSGAATSAKQPALGTAGTASADVITVQGIASMTALKVDGSAVTQPVSDGGGSVTVDGTVAATQSGTWNVTNVSGTVSLPTGASTSAKQDTANTSLASIDGKITAVNTGAVVVSSSALPTGASTAAKQPALGTAGTPAADVITVQGASGMTALKVDGSAVTQPVSGTVTANIGTAGSLALDATLTGGTQKTKLVDSGGTNVATVSAAGAVKVDGSAVTQPVSGTFWQATQPVSGTVTANAGTQLPQKTYYPQGSQTITISPQNVASSSTFIAGVESDAISNVSNLDLDHLIAGQWRCGTTPTANTQVQVWVVPCISDDLSSSVTWPDVFDGTASAETVTSAGVLYGLGRLGAILTVDSATSARDYFCAPFSVRALFGGVMPTRYVLFIAHNTGVNSDTTAGNFVWKYTRVQQKAA